jgi:hypothetical protein
MGFGILLGLVAYYFLARAVAKAVEKKTGSKKAKYAAIAVFVLIPTWDILPGWLYFQYLCQMEGGQKIYKTVELPQEYFLKTGEVNPFRRDPAHPTKNATAVGGELKRDKLIERYAVPHEWERYFSRLFHIDKVSTIVQDKQTGQTLGMATDFRYFGGWVSDFLSDHTSPIVCPEHEPGQYIHDTLPEKIFKPSPGKGE